MPFNCFSSLRYDIEYYIYYNNSKNKNKKSIWMTIEDWVADKLSWLNH